MPVFQNFSRDRSGSIAILFGLVIMVLLGAVGLAIDYSRALSSSEHLQESLDAAVLAGIKADEGQQDSVAMRVLKTNIGKADTMSLNAVFSAPDRGLYSGTANAKLKTHFMAMLGMPEFQVTRTATARIEEGGRVCVLVLDPTATQAFLVNSGAMVQAPDCEIHVKSTANPAAIFNAGSSIDTKRICIAGSSIIDNGGTHPNLQTSCPAANDPYAGTLTEPASGACDYSDLNHNGGTVNLKPGVYCGWHNFNNQPDVRFDPGVYVIKNGGWNVNGGTWVGSDVTFYFADQSKIQFNSAVAADLKAPTSGPYADVILFEKEGLARSHFVLDDSRGFNLTGLIYLPSRDTIFNSASNLAAKEFTLVVNTLILDDTNWQLSPDSSKISSGARSIARLVK